MKHTPLIFLGLYGVIFAWGILGYERVFLGDLTLVLSLIPWSLVVAPSWGWGNDMLYWLVVAVEACLNGALFYGVGLLVYKLYMKLKR